MAFNISRAAAVAARYIKNGTIRLAGETLIHSYSGLAGKKHDGAADALVWLILAVPSESRNSAYITSSRGYRG
jgi:hypothetical protein